MASSSSDPVYEWDFSLAAPSTDDDVFPLAGQPTASDLPINQEYCQFTVAIRPQLTLGTVNKWRVTGWESAVQTSDPTNAEYMDAVRSHAKDYISQKWLEISAPSRYKSARWRFTKAFDTYRSSLLSTDADNAAEAGSWTSIAKAKEDMLRAKANLTARVVDAFNDGAFELEQRLDETCALMQGANTERRFDVVFVSGV